jgi:hypothetical protein
MGLLPGFEIIPGKCWASVSQFNWWAVFTDHMISKVYTCTNTHRHTHTKFHQTSTMESKLIIIFRNQFVPPRFFSHLSLLITVLVWKIGEANTTTPIIWEKNLKLRPQIKITEPVGSWQNHKHKLSLFKISLQYPIFKHEAFFSCNKLPYPDSKINLTNIMDTIDCNAIPILKSMVFSSLQMKKQTEVDIPRSKILELK